MKTLFDEMESEIRRRAIEPVSRLLRRYEDEKDVAKCYSTFAYLSCAGAGGSRELAHAMGRLIESFYLATSVHDDALDDGDESIRATANEFSKNTYIVLGDCFFVRMSLALSRATPFVESSAREIVLQNFEQYMLDVAESQIADERSQGTTPNSAEAIKQMELRGGTWGKLCVEIPALAGGLTIDSATRLADAGRNLFLALTVRDDLMDLRDDLQNGVLTLAPALFLDDVRQQPSDFQFPMATAQSSAFIDLLHSDGAIDAALDQGREYASNAIRIVSEVLHNQDDMNWYLLLMLFRIMDKRFQEFTSEHVKEQRLGSGLSGLEAIDDLDVKS